MFRHLSRRCMLCASSMALPKVYVGVRTAHHQARTVPVTIESSDAVAQITAWCSAPGAVIVNPTTRHADVLTTLLSSVGTGGNLVNGGHLATLALEHRARIVFYDNDFGRFEGVKWDVPESLLG